MLICYLVNYKPKYFFEKFATSRGFDPLVARNWYMVSEEQVKEFEVWRESGVRVERKFYTVRGERR